MSQLFFYNEFGIVHQKSCVYRSQQNARAEWKHRHVLEVARSLKFQYEMSLSYWGEFVLTAVHIINRLPSSVLQNKIPHVSLYKKPTPYEH